MSPRSPTPRSPLRMPHLTDARIGAAAIFRASSLAPKRRPPRTALSPRGFARSLPVVIDLISGEGPAAPPALRLSPHPVPEWPIHALTVTLAPLQHRRSLRPRARDLVPHDGVRHGPQAALRRRAGARESTPARDRASSRRRSQGLRSE